MQPLPDITPILKGGIIGVLCSIILALCGALAWFIKNHMTSASRLAGPPREPLTGEKPTEYWESVLKDIEKEGNQALLQVLSEQHRATMLTLGKIRARLRDSDNEVLLKRFDSFERQYKQDMVSIAKMLRGIEVKFDK